MLWSEKVENVLKLLFKNVSECSGTLGERLGTITQWIKGFKCMFWRSEEHTSELQSLV